MESHRECRALRSELESLRRTTAERVSEMGAVLGKTRAALAEGESAMREEVGRLERALEVERRARGEAEERLK